MDETGNLTGATAVRRITRRAQPEVAGDGPVVRPAAVGGGPRLVPRRVRQDWRALALALEGARELEPHAVLSPQLCAVRRSPPAGAQWLHEIKWDGYRLLARIHEGNATLCNRVGKDWTARLPGIARALEALGLRQGWIDGEVVALDRRGRSDFAALQRALRSGDTDGLRLLAFDLPALQGVDLRAVPLHRRKQLLERLLASGSSASLAYSRHLQGHGERVFAASLRQGVEGIVSKRADSRYSGRRSQDWVKVRHEDSDEFVVVGYSAGGRSGLGSLWLARRQDQRLHYAGRVSSGWDAGAARELVASLHGLQQARPAVALPAAEAGMRQARWVRPRAVVEVAYRGWGPQGQLRRPVFRRACEGRDLRELEPETGMDIRITHPERIVFADAGISKGEVADYHRAVARWMLPELVGRPLALLRCPEGTAADCFFQKHHKEGFGDAVRAVTLQQQDGPREGIYIEDLDGLLALVQMNALEIHAWGSRVDDPDQPDRLVFDLDPDDSVVWKQVVAAAREVRSRLAEAGLESFVRLSGGKGLHVVAPIARGPTWDQAKDFCQSVAVAMATQHPQRYVATMAKARREGRIFIDWLRNARGATSVCSWSLRAREGAPVAMPLRWQELARVEGPAAYDMRRALRRAASLRKDPWEGIGSLAQSLPA